MGLASQVIYAMSAARADLEKSLRALTSGLRARRTEPTIGGRYSGCAPLMRITAAFVGNADWARAVMSDEGLRSQLAALLAQIMETATNALASSDEMVSSTSLHDTLGSVALETITVALSQAQLIMAPSITHLCALEAHAAHATAEASSAPSLPTGLREIIKVLALRLTPLAGEAMPAVLPRLSDAAKRLFNAIQRHLGGDFLATICHACAADQNVGASRMSAHLSQLSVAAPHAPLMQLYKLPPVIENVDAACAAPAEAAAASRAYTVLPPQDAFEIITANVWPTSLTHAADVERVMGLPVAPAHLQSALARLSASGCSKDHVAVGDGENELYMVSRRAYTPGELILELCGEIVPYEQVEHLSDDLAKYKSIWPAEYYVLHFGSAESVDSDRDAPRGSGFALDISRAASFARLVRHDSDNPNCALFPCRTHKSEGDSGDDGWQPRLCVVALRPLAPGERITANFAPFAFGGAHQSHMQADWRLGVPLSRLALRHRPHVLPRAPDSASLSPQAEVVTSSPVALRPLPVDVSVGAHVATETVTCTHTANSDGALADSTEGSSIALVEVEVIEVSSEIAPPCSIEQVTSSVIGQRAEDLPSANGTSAVDVIPKPSHPCASRSSLMAPPAADGAKGQRKSLVRALKMLRKRPIDNLQQRLRKWKASESALGALSATRRPAFPSAAAGVTAHAQPPRTDSTRTPRWV